MLEVLSITDDVAPKSATRHVITDIKEAVHKKERVNIYINDKFFCSLDISQVVDFHIKIGKELSETELADIKSASEFGKFYSLALEYVFLRPHSTKEIKDYLLRKTISRKVRVKNRKTGEYQIKDKPGYDKSLVDIVLKRLDEKGYLDDYHFARVWVENRNVKKGISSKKIQAELREKGIASQIIDQVLNETKRSDEDELKKVINRVSARYSDRQKLIQYLLRQGFNYSDILDELSLAEDSFDGA